MRLRTGWKRKVWRCWRQRAPRRCRAGPAPWMRPRRPASPVPGRGRTGDCRGGIGSSSRAWAARWRRSRSGNLRLGRLRVRQEDAARAAFDDRGRDARILDVGQALRGEDDRHVLLAQRLEPLANARGKHRVIEEQPGFIEDQQRGRTVKALIEARKEVVQHGHDGGLAVHQFLHLEALHGASAQAIRIRIQQLAVGAAQHVRRKRLAQRIRLQQYRQARHRALFHRRTGETAERRPDSGLLFGADGHALMPQAPFDPFGGPGAVALAVDAGERLKRDLAIHPEVVVLTTQPEDGGAHRAPHVEGKDARAAIAPKLHRQGGEQHRLAHARRASHQRVAHVADVRHQPERRRALSARDDQRRAVEVRVLLRPGPYRRHRHQVRQVQRGDDGLADVGVGMARNGRQPRIHGVERFGDGDEATPLDDALHPAQLLVGHGGIRVHDGDGRCHVAEGHLIAAQLLQGGIGIGGLVAGVGIDQRAFLLEDRLAQQRDDVLAFGEPLTAQAGEFFFRLGFVQAEKARTPAIREAQTVEVVQNPRPSRDRKTAHRHHAQVLVAQHRRQATDQRRVGQQRIEVEWHLGHAHAVTPCRHGGVQVGQRLAIVEPGDLRHHAVEQVKDAFRLRDEGSQALAPIDAFGQPVLVQQARGTGTGLLGRQVHQREVVGHDSGSGNSECG